MMKMVALTVSPSASVITATAVNPGLLRKRRIAKRMSFIRFFIAHSLHCRSWIA